MLVEAKDSVAHEKTEHNTIDAENRWESCINQSS